MANDVTGVPKENWETAKAPRLTRARGAPDETSAVARGRSSEGEKESTREDSRAIRQRSRVRRLEFCRGAYRPATGDFERRRNGRVRENRRSLARHSCHQWRDDARLGAPVSVTMRMTRPLRHFLRARPHASAYVIRARPRHLSPRALPRRAPPSPRAFPCLHRSPRHGVVVDQFVPPERHVQLAPEGWRPDLPSHHAPGTSPRRPRALERTRPRARARRRRRSRR